MLREISYMILLVLLIAGAGLYVLPHPAGPVASTSSPDPWTVSAQLLQPDIANKEILSQLQQQCPYSQPGLEQFQQCLTEALDYSEQAADSDTDGLTVVLALYAKELRAEQVSAGGAEQEALAADLTQLQGSWKADRDAWCDDRLSSTQLEAASSSVMTICKLYRTERYSAQLRALQQEQVEDPIRAEYIEGRTPIKTKVFRELVGQMEAANGRSAAE